MPTVDQVLEEIWSDSRVRASLLANPAGFLREKGLDVPANADIQVHEDTISTKNFVLPDKIEGEIPDTGDPVVGVMKRAMEDDAFKKRLLSDPRAAASEMGVDVPDGVNIKVWENRGNTQHLILPMNPDDAELSDADLEAVAGGLSKQNQINVTCGSGALVTGVAAATFGFTAVTAAITGVGSAVIGGVSVGGSVAQSESEAK